MKIKWMSRWPIGFVSALVLGAIVTVGVVELGSTGGSTSAIASVVVDDPAVIAEDLASVVASRTGVDPSEVTVVATTRQRADRLFGSNSVGVDPLSEVLVFEFEGEFVDAAMHRPAGSDATNAGTAIVFVVDRGTGRSSEYGLLSRPVDLSAAGEPVRIALHGQPR